MCTRKSKLLLVLALPVMFAGTTTASHARAQSGDGGGAPPPVQITQQFDGDYTGILPPLASERGARIDRLMGIIHIFMGVLFVPWLVFFGYCLFKFRHRPGHRASPELPKAKISKWAEIGVAAFEVVLLLGFSIPIWAEVKDPTRDPNYRPDQELHIRCIAEQFQWNFHFPGKDGRFGRTDPKLVDLARNPLGIDRSDPAAEDDFFTVGFLSIPVDRPIRVDLTSKDVIHSFAVPVLRVKQDAIPGMSIPVTFDANRTGKFQVACAQLCGNNHYKMYATMDIVSAEQFDAWLEEQAKGPEDFDDD